MKKQGFTLIELLAVIVIMGILMFAAIPAINRTIENARKDQFVDTAQNYARAVETLWYADGLECKMEMEHLIRKRQLYQNLRVIVLTSIQQEQLLQQ